MGVNLALADHDFFEGKVNIKETCYDGEGNPPVVRVIKSFAEMEYDPAESNEEVQGDDSPFPAWDDFWVWIEDFYDVGQSESFEEVVDGAEQAGTALSKNRKRGIWSAQAENQDVNPGEILLNFDGKIVVKDGDGVKAKARVSGRDWQNNCTYKGNASFRRPSSS
jgi:hypothetical protein